MRETKKISRFVKESTRTPMNERMAMQCGRSNLGLSLRPGPSAINIAVIARHQTTDEQHRFQAATDALLAELVRQHLGRGSNK